MTRHGWIRWTVLLGGLVLLGVLFLRLGPAQIVSLFQSLGWNLIIVVLIFTAHECVRALAVRRCLAGDAPPFRFLLKTRFLGEGLRTLTYTGPFLSEPARAWMLTRAGLSGEHAAAGATSELIANSGTSAVMAAASLGFMLVRLDLGAPLRVFSHVLVWTSVAYAAVIAVALWRRIYVIGAIVQAVSRIPMIGRSLRVDPLRLRTMEDGIFRVLRDHPPILIDVLLLEFLAQALLVLDVYWTLYSMGISSSPVLSIQVEALTKLVNVVQFVGVSEGGYALIFNWLAIPAAAGFTLSIVKRVRSLAVAALGLALFSGSLRQDASAGSKRAHVVL